MIRRSSCLLLFLAGLPLSGQPDGMAVYVDLSGEWRTRMGEDSRFADPALDDSSWSAVQVPIKRGLSERRMVTQWFRKKVELPDGVEPGTPLAVTIGALSEAQLFVNGERVPATGQSPSAEIEVARPRIFEFPAPRQKLLSLAVRVHTTRLPAAWYPIDVGPWLLSSARAAPKDEPLHALAMQKLFRMGDLTQALILLCLATVVLLIWMGQRDRRELLWFGLYMTIVALGRANLFVQIGPEPLILPWFSMIGVLGLLPAAVLARFVSVWTGQQWMVWPTWILTAIGLCIPRSAPLTLTFLPSWIAAAIVLVALANYVRRQTSDAPLVAGVVLIVYTHASSWTGIDLLGLPRLVQYNSPGWLPFAFVWHLLATSVFGLVLTLILVRRLLRDREERLRLAGEFQAARALQQFLLPARETSVPGYELQVVYEPAQEVGGDFHWSRGLPDGSLLVAVGDVSGKGLKAAMLTSVIVGILRNEKSCLPAEILGALNEGLAGQTDGGFVTCCCARFDPDGQVTIANAGHLSPYCDGREVAVATGLPLGVVAGVAYEESVARGDRFTFVSDGVVEAENAQRELLGFDRTRDISTKSAAQIAEAAKAWGQNDDITVVTVRRKDA